VAQVFSGNVRLLTNIEDFPKKWRSASGVEGTAQVLSTAWAFVRNSPRCDGILINCNPALTLQLAAIFVFLPFRRKPIIALDLVLRRPVTQTSKLTRRLKKFLLGRVDQFIHYFRDWAGYEKYFGIGNDRNSYVPFKTDLRGRFPYSVNPNGEYVLCFGRSERDFDTFIKAMAELPYPGVIPDPNYSLLNQHSSRFTVPLSDLPANVTIIENRDNMEAALEMIAKAHVVALPLVANRISASGIGTYLTAMLLGKCVIITEGPGSSDVLSNEALFVPAEDPHALAAMIRRAWEDKALREKTAAAGQAYVEQCGNSADLYQRVVDLVVKFLSRERKEIN
jgi:glycosyltransferase involved in cell wall biosynthesis